MVWRAFRIGNLDLFGVVLEQGRELNGVEGNLVLRAGLGDFGGVLDVVEVGGGQGGVGQGGGGIVGVGQGGGRIVGVAVGGGRRDRLGVGLGDRGGCFCGGVFYVYLKEKSGLRKM